MDFLSLKKVLIFFSLLAIVVVLVAIFLPVRKPESQTPTNANQLIESSDGESVSNLFEVKDKKKLESRQVVPTDIPKEEACTLNGQVVRNGTVSSNTICVNVSSPTP